MKSLKRKALEWAKRNAVDRLPYDEFMMQFMKKYDNEDRMREHDRNFSEQDLTPKNRELHQQKMEPVKASDEGSAAKGDHRRNQTPTVC